jgi:acyl transferase domain-containing protein/NADPH:quinone reductase-like Zn-dependent oxidoreductase/SAM-dependent methyltransferase/acyl carrier protein
MNDDPNKREPLAIIGVGCHFPGGVNGPEGMWELLLEGRDGTSEIPHERWSQSAFHYPEPSPGTTQITRMGAIEGVDQFDPYFFGISPREAAVMDPQQRLMLETAVEALEDAGQRIDALAGTRTGVFAGVSFSDYGRFSSPEYFDYHSTAGVAAAIIPNRVSHCLDLKGPSLSIDTACSSSLVAVHMACRSLWNRESDLALAAGANVLLDPTGFVAFSRAAIINPEGRCYAFDARAQGFVRSEGVGVVILKRLDEALRDGDPVYAVILNSGVNQDGCSVALGVPSAQAQKQLLRDVYREAEIPPERVLFVEAHGTGTPVGDPIEATGIGRALVRKNGGELLLGSVKTNLGHLECGSGVTGLIKAALALKHRVVPANLNFEVPNPDIPFQELGLRVPIENVPFPASEVPWVAGVNSFGFGGTNAHVVLTEPPREEPAAAAAAPTRFLLPLSARSPVSLEAMMKAYRDFLTEPKASLYDVCYTAALRRSHHRHRAAISGRTAGELVDALEARLQNPPPVVPVRGDERRLAFVYTGQGPQWWGMGRQLLAREPVFREVVEKCDAIIRTLGGWSLLEQFQVDESASQMEVTAIAQPAIFALQAGLTELWRSRGVEPDGVVGHSVGEVAAAYAAGVLSLEEATRVIFHRGRCMELASPHGKMLAVGLSAEAAVSLLEPFDGSVSLAAINGPNSVTLSGQPEPLEALANELGCQSVFCKFLRVNYAFHSAQMDPVELDLKNSLAGLAPSRALLPLFSTVTGEETHATDWGPDYWWRNVREPVRFSPAIERLIDGGYRIFLEVGPHPVLAAPLNECLRHRNTRGASLASLQRGADESETLLDAMGALYTHGHAIDWARLYPTRGRVVALPRYAWQHERHWHEAPLRRWDRVTDLVHPLLGRQLPMALPTWANRLDLVRHAYVQHHCLQGHPLLPATAYLEMALAAGGALKSDAPMVEDMEFDSPCFLPGGGFVPVQTSLSPDDGSFAVHTHDDELRFVVHARGRVRTGAPLRRPPRAALDEIQRRLPQRLSGDQMYEHMARRGLDHSAPFRAVQAVWRRDGEALAEVSWSGDGDGYRWHPAHLDACLHAVFLTLPNGGSEPLLPAALERFCVYGKPGATAFAHVQLTRASEASAECDVTVFDPDGETLAALSGLRLSAVELPAGTRPSGILYENRWRLEHHPIRQRQRSNLTALPSPAQVVATIEKAVADDRVESPVAIEAYDRYMEDSQRMAAEIVADALAKLGWDPQPGDRFTAVELRNQLGIATSHERLFDEYLRMFAEDGYLARDAHGWSVLSPPQRRDGEALIAIMKESMPVREPWIEVLARCVPHLPEVLTDRLMATDVLFPEGSVDQVSDFYTNSPVFWAINRQLECVSEALVQRFPAGYGLRVLEVGAGTGAATAKLLPGLPAELSEYVYTDLSSHFFRQARQRFADYPFLRYETLDLEQDPAAQGFEEHSYDIVIIYQVVHATNDIRQSMRHVARLLASDGILVMVEVERPLPRMASLTFGLTWGWWRFSDHDLRQTSPLLTEPEWLQVFAETGLVDTAVLRSRMASAGNLLLVTRAQPLEPVAEPIPEPPDGAFLVLADRGGVGERLAARIEEQGRDCMLVHLGERFVRRAQGRFEVRPDSLQDLCAVLEGAGELAGVVHLWNLDAEDEPHNLDRLTGEVQAGSYSLVLLVQAMEKAARSPRLWMATRAVWSVVDGEPVSPAGAPAWGVARVIGSEYPTSHPTLIDLDPSGGDQDEALFNEIWSGPGGEEVALRGDDRYVRRLRRVARRALSAPDLRGNPRDVPYRLETRAAGDLDQLALVATPASAPGPGEVTVEVAASGLNFADVLKATNLYPRCADADVLGIELAGTVTRIGPGVTRFRVGDRVMGLGRYCFASQATTLADLLAAIPDPMSFQEAATIPVAFLTAQFALVHRAGLTAGERVLIHSASGGVGLAAVQVARRMGAVVLATAGNPERRAFLSSLGIGRVMDSRSLDFAEEVMEETDGRGVDVVLNSLAGEGADAGLSILAPYGRFVEIGKRDLYANRRIGLRPLVENRTLVTVDLHHACSNRPELIRQLFDEVLKGFEAGAYAPLPHRVYPIVEAVEAFRFMSGARHIGKLVFIHELDEVVVRPRCRQRLAADASYLISGGLGGFSLAVAEWMVGQGARHLVLMGRNHPCTEAQAAIEQLRQGGAEVKVVSADVCDAGQVARAVKDIGRTMPPLRGVVHAATTLCDHQLSEMDPESWQTALGPKLKGAWVLHEQTRKLPLDLFLMFSSTAAMTANPEQGNYAAGCAFLESLAEHRGSLGLPGQTVAWGLIDRVGSLARREAFELLARRGLLPLDPNDALEPLGGFLSSPLSNLAVARVDWGRFRDSWAPRETLPGRFQCLAAEQGIDARQETPVLHLLATATGERRRLLVVDSLAARTARVLGCEVERLELARPLRELGLDSLTSFELRNWVQESFGVTLAAADLVHWPSVDDLADRILELLDAEVPPPVGAVPDKVPAEEVDDRAEAELATLREGLEAEA